jgi:hypothetical protein
MDLGTLRTQVRDLNATVLGVPIVVSTPRSASPPTRGVWHRSLEEDAPFGTAFRKVSPRRLMTIAVDGADLPLQRGDLLRAAEHGQAERSWRVDELARVDPQRMAVVLVPVSELP